MQRPKLSVLFSGSCPPKRSVTITINDLLHFGLISVETDILENIVRSHCPFWIIHNFASDNFSFYDIQREWLLMIPPSPPRVQYRRGCWCIRGAFHDKFPGSSGFIFFRKLARTKNQQVTDKASEYNRRTVFSRALVLLMCASTRVILTSSYHLSSIHYNS